MQVDKVTEHNSKNVHDFLKFFEISNIADQLLPCTQNVFQKLYKRMVCVKDIQWSAAASMETTKHQAKEIRTFFCSSTFAYNKTHSL